MHGLHLALLLEDPSQNPLPANLFLEGRDVQRFGGGVDGDGFGGGESGYLVGYRS